MTFRIDFPSDDGFDREADRDFLSESGNVDRVSCFGRENSAHVDEVVGNHAQSNPSPHAIMAAIATPFQSMSAFQNTDSPLTACSPLLTLSKPPRLLNLAK